MSQQGPDLLQTTLPSSIVQPPLIQERVPGFGSTVDPPLSCSRSCPDLPLHRHHGHRVMELQPSPEHLWACVGHGRMVACGERSWGKVTGFITYSFYFHWLLVRLSWFELLYWTKRIWRVVQISFWLTTLIPPGGGKSLQQLEDSQPVLLHH